MEIRTRDYKISEDELKTLYFNRPMEARMRSYARLWVLSLLCLIVGFMWQTKSMFVAAVVLALLPISDYFSTRRMVKKYVHDPRNQSTLIEKTYSVIDEEGIKGYSESGAYSLVPWDHIVQLKRYRDYLLLYVTSDRFFHFGPQHFLTSKDWEDFCVLARSKTKQIKP